MFTYYKNDSVRKLVIGFGNLFNGIQIEQTNTDNSNVYLMFHYLMLLKKNLLSV